MSYMSCTIYYIVHDNAKTDSGGPTPVVRVGRSYVDTYEGGRGGGAPRDDRTKKEKSKFILLS